MAGTSAGAEALPTGGSPKRPRRLGRISRAVGAVIVLAAVAFAASALIPGSHSSPGVPARFGVLRTANRSSSRNTLAIHVTTVFGASGSAKRYGTLDAKREGQGVDAQGRMTSDLTPLAVSAFKQPVAAYRRYAEHWAGVTAGAVATLQTALADGDRASAERAWNVAFFDFMHLGADYNLLPTGLTDQLAEIPSSVDQKHFPGLHRIEKGLWTGQPLSTLIPVADGVAAATAKLQRTLPTVPIDTLGYTLRIHEILEDAQRDLLSGADVPWSGSGVEATEAGVLATQELLRTVKPILQGRDNSYGESTNWLIQLQRTLLKVRRADGGWPTVGQLTDAQREQINGMMAGTLSALEQVPGALETKSIDGFPSIPKQRHGTR